MNVAPSSSERYSVKSVITVPPGPLLWSTHRRCTCAGELKVAEAQPPTLDVHVTQTVLVSSSNAFGTVFAGSSQPLDCSERTLMLPLDPSAVSKNCTREIEVERSAAACAFISTAHVSAGGVHMAAGSAADEANDCRE